MTVEMQLGKINLEEKHEKPYLVDNVICSLNFFP